MYDILYLFKGMLVGLMVSIPLGPMGVLIIQKTLHKGALSGFIAGNGCCFCGFLLCFGGGIRVGVRDKYRADS